MKKIFILLLLTSISVFAVGLQSSKLKKIYKCARNSNRNMSIRSECKNEIKSALKNGDSIFEVNKTINKAKKNNLLSDRKKYKLKEKYSY